MCCVVRDVHNVVRSIKPNADFTERIAVNLVAFVFRRVARDIRNTEKLKLCDWPKVARLFSNLKLSTKVVTHTAHDPNAKAYLSRVQCALVDLPIMVDTEEAFQTELALALGSLARVGRIMGEVDFAYLGVDSAAKVGKIVEILKKAQA